MRQKERMRRLVVVMVLAAVPLAVTSVAAAGGGGGCPAATGDARGLEVGMEGSCFGPQVIRVHAGETVTFRNFDPYPHTVTGAGLEWGSNHLISHGDSVTATFDQPGVYPYMCNLHPGMVGAVVVGDGAPTAGEASAAPLPMTADGDSATSPGIVSAAAALLALTVIALVLRQRRQVQAE